MIKSKLKLFRSISSSNIIQDLKEECLDTPTEITDGSRAQQLLTRAQKQKEEYEENYLTRLPVTKAEKHRQRKLTTLGTYKKCLQFLHIFNHSLLMPFNLQALSAMRSPVLVISVRWVDRHRVDCQKAKSESQKANRSVVVARNENSTEQAKDNAISTKKSLSFLETHISNHNKTSLNVFIILFFFFTQLYSQFCWIINFIFLTPIYGLFSFFLCYKNLFHLMVFLLIWLNWIFSWCDSSLLLHLYFILDSFKLCQSTKFTFFI